VPGKRVEFGVDEYVHYLQDVGNKISRAVSVGHAVCVGNDEVQWQCDKNRGSMTEVNQAQFSGSYRLISSCNQPFAPAGGIR
jgi:hypothetical protein